MRKAFVVDVTGGQLFGWMSVCFVLFESVQPARQARGTYNTGRPCYMESKKKKEREVCKWRGAFRMFCFIYYSFEASSCDEYGTAY